VCVCVWLHLGYAMNKNVKNIELIFEHTFDVIIQCVDSVYSLFLNKYLFLAFFFSFPFFLNKN
jgi:hypothetical protein